MNEFKRYEDSERGKELSIENCQDKIEGWSKFLNEKLKLNSKNFIEQFSPNDKELLNTDVTVNMNRFYQEHGTEKIEKDNENIRTFEGYWIKKGSKSIRQYLDESKQNFTEDELIKIEKSYKKQGKRFWNSDADKKEADIILEKFNADKQKSTGILWEKAKTVLFNELLETNFIVVRASKHDDYNSGVDNIIINKSTGDAICAFDEINSEENSSFHEDKKNKVDTENKLGGATIEYGVTVKDSELVAKQFENIPIFTLRISEDSLVELLEALSFEDKGKEEENERIKIEIFEELLGSLEDQTKNLKQNENTESENILRKIEGIINEDLDPKIIEEVKDFFDPEQEQKEKKKFEENLNISETSFNLMRTIINNTKKK